MKIIRYILCMLFVLILFNTSYAFKNEPDGFRGIKWGSEAEKYKELQLDAGNRDITKDFKVYTRKNELLKIGDINIGYVKYHFYKNKFYEAIVDYDWDDKDALEKNLSSVYGQGRDDYSTQAASITRFGKACKNHYWIGKNVDIRLIQETTSYEYPVTPESMVFSSYISFTYKPINKQKERDFKMKYDQENKIKTSKENEEKRRKEQEMRKKVEKDL